MEITIPAVKEEAESWAKRNLRRFLLMTYCEDIQGRNVVKVSLDPAFGRALSTYMEEWARDVKLVATVVEEKQ